MLPQGPTITPVGIARRESTATPKPALLLLLGFHLGLYACAPHPPLRDIPYEPYDWSWVRAPVEEPPPEPVPSETPGSISLETDRFAVAKGDGIIGSLGAMPLRQGDTLPDIARHFGLGYEEIVAANPGLDPWVPGTGGKVLIPLQFTLPKAPRRGVVINLAGLRLFHFPAKGKGAEVVTYPVGIGREGKATPSGAMRIARKAKNPTWYPTKSIRDDHARRGDPLPAAVPPGPDNPLGQYALYLSRPMYLIHGTNKPYSVGLRASNGCIRMYPENAVRLYSEVPLREPVHIVNQPYLVGRRAGEIYLQAYPSPEELNEKALRDALRAELKDLERNETKPLDWGRIDRILDEGRGIPLPISAGSPPVDAVLAKAPRVVRPSEWFGQPEAVPLTADGWRVLATETVSEKSAKRIAAILRHQGPPIPAGVVPSGENYQVLAGPFADAKAAKAALRRLKVDLELEGQIIAPESEQAAIAPAEVTPTETPTPDAQDAAPSAWDAMIPEEAPVEAVPPAADSAETDHSGNVDSEGVAADTIDGQVIAPDTPAAEWSTPEPAPTEEDPDANPPNVPLELPPELETPGEAPVEAAPLGTDGTQTDPSGNVDSEHLPPDATGEQGTARDTPPAFWNLPEAGPPEEYPDPNAPAPPPEPPEEIENPDVGPGSGSTEIW